MSTANHAAIVVVIPWHLKELRKTCDTDYDEHIPESSVEIPGHAVGGITFVITPVLIRWRFEPCRGKLQFSSMIPAEIFSIRKMDVMTRGLMVHVSLKRLADCWRSVKTQEWHLQHHNGSFTFVHSHSLR